WSPAIFCYTVAQVGQLPGLASMYGQQVNLHGAAAITRECESVSIGRPARSHVMRSLMLFFPTIGHLPGRFSFARFAMYEPDSAAGGIRLAITLLAGESDQ